MGQCATQDLERNSTALDEQLWQDNDKLSAVNVLLLGPGESGKSTFMKQLVHLYGSGHDPEKFRHIIARNIINNIYMLIEKSEEWSKDTPRYAVSSSHTLAIEQLKDVYEQSMRMDSEEVMGIITPDVAQTVKAVWHDAGIQHVYKHRARTQLLDSSAYFFERVKEISSLDYVPTTTDIILSRTRTSGFTEALFEFEGDRIRITDVGGQRSERKKWLHFFEDTSICVFFIALSEYDRTLYEDNSVSRMEEALKLFEEICYSRWFRSTHMVLFLNKADLFREKIEQEDIQEFFPDFPKPQTYENGCNYFKKLFLGKNIHRNRKIDVHFTNMIDGESVPTSFSEIGVIAKEISAMYRGEYLMVI